MSFYLKFLLVLFFVSCTRLTPSSRDKAMRTGVQPASFESLKVDNEFKERITVAIEALKKKPERVVTFGTCNISSIEYAKLLETAFKELNDEEKLRSTIKKLFDWYEVYGRDKWGEILLTSYYSPVIEGRKIADGQYSYPLFSIPSDLVEVEMSQFSEKDLVMIDTENSRSKVAARIKKGWNGVSRIVPYYSRTEIDNDFSLVSNKASVIAYVKPIEAFFFHIQGSGLIQLKSGELLSLGYAAQNGHRYYSIGKLLYDRIPKEEMTKAKIENFLEGLEVSELFEFLGNNPSYVFFNELKTGLGRTTFGPEVIKKGTIAVDPSFISLGSLAFLEYESPLFLDELQSAPDSFSVESRFVWAHDTGGAIKSAGRADLYWGQGISAGQSAGVINQMAKLWALGPKDCRSNN